MAIPLRQSTASQEIPIGYFVDSTDGNTEETGLTIANTDVKIWKAGATTLANKNSGGATHISNGIYYLVLDATDTNTLGPMEIFVHVSGALPVRRECVVFPANVYDSLIAGSDALQVDTIQLSGTTQTARDIGASVLLSPGTGTGQISLTSGAVTAGTVSDKTGYSLTATTGLGNQTANITGNLSGSVGSVTGGINTGAGTITTLDGLDTAQDSQHATTQSAIGALNDLDAAGVAGAVWNAATATYGTAGSYGLLVETNLDAAVSTAGGDDAATIWTYATRILTANTNLNDPTVADIRAEIDSNSTQLAALVADNPNRPTKNVAFSNFSFLMVDATDFATPETGLTVSGEISKDGAAFGALTNSVIEIANGMYKVNLTQAEMNADVISLRFTATGAADRLITIYTQPT